MASRYGAVVVFLSLLAGFTGGAGAVYFFAGEAALAVRPAEMQEVLEAERIVLKDGQGRTRAELAVKEIPALGQESVGLFLFDKNGETGLELKLLNEAPFLTMFSKGGETGSRSRAVLRVNQDGMPSLILRDESGTDRSVIGYTHFLRKRTGVPETRRVSSIVLFDKYGRVRWSAP